MSTQIQMAERFLALHRQQQPLLLPNPWDLGSPKRVLEKGSQYCGHLSEAMATVLSAAFEVQMPSAVVEHLYDRMSRRCLRGI